ncbi:MAG: hypothetical protein IJL87_04620 [Clostridia bacterium]|nr:hypothetical protein [Clostridia bacterium]
MAGTYKIDLSDFSSEKISDKIFNGMFNFDDKALYCCTDEGEVYRMSPDGELTLLFDI